MDKVVSPNAKEKGPILYLIDNWTGHNDLRFYEENYQNDQIFIVRS